MSTVYVFLPEKGGLPPFSLNPFPEVFEEKNPVCTFSYGWEEVFNSPCQPEQTPGLWGSPPGTETALGWVQDRTFYRRNPIWRECLTFTHPLWAFQAAFPREWETQASPRGARTPRHWAPNAAPSCPHPLPAPPGLRAERRCPARSRGRPPQPWTVFIWEREAPSYSLGILDLVC